MFPTEIVSACEHLSRFCSDDALPTHATPCTPTTVHKLVASALIAKLNYMRMDNSMGRLSVSPQLTCSAQLQAEYMGLLREKKRHCKGALQRAWCPRTVVEIVGTSSICGAGPDAHAKNLLAKWSQPCQARLIILDYYHTHVGCGVYQDGCVTYASCLFASE